MYFLSKLPAEVDFGETLAVLIMALTLSFLATLYPSWRAARLIRSMRSGTSEAHAWLRGLKTYRSSIFMISSGNTGRAKRR